MTKYIVVIGGVISSVGKGVITASLGKIFKEYGYRVSLIKIDPYINYDAGTLRPTEHGEVWVTDEGGEIDQDFGTYERFMGEPIPTKNSITTGQIYKAVIDRERSGGYLGKTVQCIPHVVDEIRARIEDAARGHDIAIIELGGIVGDYENTPFLYAVKSLEQMYGRDAIAYVHVTYLPIPDHVGEMKTKPAQHALSLLNQSGIFPDLIMCRASQEVDEIRKRKVAMFSHIPSEHIISCPDVASIYQVPLDLQEKGVGQKLLRILNLQPRITPAWSAWRGYVHNICAPRTRITIGIIGKYLETGDFNLTDSYLSIAHALTHAGAALDVGIDIRWLNAQQFERSPVTLSTLDTCNGIIVPGGFGTDGVEGKIAAITYAREREIAYLGICYGMHLAVVEYARHVAHLSTAHTTEVNATTDTPVVTILPWQQQLLENNVYGGSMRLGSYAASLTPGSLVNTLYTAAGRTTLHNVVTERHRHRYEINPAYVPLLQKYGLVFSGYHERIDGTQLMEFLELPGHPFFVATQAHPEFTSRLESPNPLFYGLVQVAAAVQQ